MLDQMHKQSSNHILLDSTGKKISELQMNSLKL